MKTKKTTIVMCLCISLLCIMSVIICSFAKMPNHETIKDIITNLSYAFLGSACITMFLTLKDYIEELKEMLEKMFFLFLQLDNEVGKQKYFVNKLSLDKLANTITSCIKYSMEINLCVRNIYNGLFLIQKKRRKEFYDFGMKFEDEYLLNFYALGQIMEKEKYYAKEHIKNIYDKLMDSIYNRNICDEMEKLLKKYKSDLKFMWLEDDVRVKLRQNNLKKLFTKENSND